jgi:hypothetical protein
VQPGKNPAAQQPGEDKKRLSYLFEKNFLDLRGKTHDSEKLKLFCNLKVYFKL